MDTASHQIWLEAHYALGRLEVAQGHTLSDKERGDFIREYLLKYNDENPDKIEA